MIDRARAGWSTLKSRYTELLAEFGQAALVVWFTIFAITWSGFYLAIRGGIDPEGLASQAGTMGGAYLATQATKPLRIGLTLVLTPPAVALWHRVRGRAEPSA